MQLRTAPAITALSIAALAFTGLALNVCVASSAWNGSAGTGNRPHRPPPYTFQLSSRAAPENLLPLQQLEQEVAVGWLNQMQ